MKPKSVAEYIEAARIAGHDALGIANDPEAISTLEKIRYGRVDVYDLEQCAAFRKTKEEHGGLSNMAGGYPIKVQLSDHSYVDIRSTEALYQACRFPDHPDIQREIIDNKSPMGAKFIAKREISKTRADWETVKLSIMRWCLNLKWIQSGKFKADIFKTESKPIVEISYKDSFWGAGPDEMGRAVGQNVLGKLLMELRMDVEEFQIGRAHV